MSENQRPLTTPSMGKPSSPLDSYGWRTPDSNLADEIIWEGQPALGARSSNDAHPQYYHFRSSSNTPSYPNSPGRSMGYLHRHAALTGGLSMQHQAGSRSHSNGFRGDVRNAQLLPMPDTRHAMPRRPHEPYRYSHSAVAHRHAYHDEIYVEQQRNHTHSLLMFGDDPETGSEMTGWSEQELLKKHSKANAMRKDKSKYKKKKGKKKKEARVLNLPPSLTFTSQQFSMKDHVPSFSRKKYLRDGDRLPGESSRRLISRSIPENHAAQHQDVMMEREPRAEFQINHVPPFEPSRSSVPRQQMRDEMVAPRGQIEDAGNKNARILHSFSRSSDEASSAVVTSQGSPDVTGGGNCDEYATAPPGSSKRDGNIFSFGEQDGGHDLLAGSHDMAHVGHSENNQLLRGVEPSSGDARQEPRPSDRYNGGLHAVSPYQRGSQVKDEESSCSSFPLLSTNAVRQRQPSRPYSSGSASFEQSSGSSFEQDSHASPTVMELLDGSFPSPNRSPQGSRWPVQEETHVSFAQDNGGEPEPYAEHEAQNRMPRGVTNDRSPNTNSTAVKTTQKDSPTSVIHLSNDDMSKNVDSRPVAEGNVDSHPQMLQQLQSRSYPKSILRTRRRVPDCPSDEGERRSELKRSERKVRIMCPPDDANMTTSPRPLGGVKNEDENGPSVVPTQNGSMASAPQARGDTFETLLDYSESTDGSDQGGQWIVDDINMVRSRQQGFSEGEADSNVLYDSAGGYVEHDDVSQGFIEAVAAVVIQTAVRRFLAMASFQKLSLAENSPKTTNNRDADMDSRGGDSECFEDLAVRMYEMAAIRIQSVFRGWWLRDSLQVDHYCATNIQRIIRGFLCRRRFQFDMYCIILVQTVWRRNLALNGAASRLAHVIAIQSTFRGYLTRKKIDNEQMNLKHTAATTIQSHWRSYDTYMNFIHTLADILIIQSLARRWLTKNRLLPYLNAQNAEAHSPKNMLTK